MLCNFLGEEVFFKGVSLYVKEHQFGNSIPVDLWDALSRTSGKSLIIHGRDGFSTRDILGTDVAKLMEN